MGVFDMAKLAKKAMDAKRKMSNLTAVGVSGAVSVLINGLYEILEVQVDKSVLNSLYDPKRISDSKELVELVSEKLTNDFQASFKSARVSLEKEMANSANIEDIKGLLLE